MEGQRLVLLILVLGDAVAILERMLWVLHIPVAMQDSLFCYGVQVRVSLTTLQARPVAVRR